VAEPSRFDTEPGDNGEVSRPGVSALFLRRNGIRHVDEVEAELRVGYKNAGILIPYSGLNVSQLMVNGRHYCRLRLDRPTAMQSIFHPETAGPNSTSRRALHLGRNSSFVRVSLKASR
jgi:hypothetical protein